MQVVAIKNTQGPFPDNRKDLMRTVIADERFVTGKVRVFVYSTVSHFRVMSGSFQGLLQDQGVKHRGCQGIHLLIHLC